MTPARILRTFATLATAAVLRDGDRDWLVYHAYDAQNGGIATLRVSPIYWTADQWPRAQL